MATKHLIRIAALAATLLAAGACIYPYEVELGQGTEWPLVVEGDILVGSTTTMTLSHVLPFGAKPEEAPVFYVRGYIEGEDGTRIEGHPSWADLGPSNSRPSTNSLTFQTAGIPAGQRYRLVFQTFDDPNAAATNAFESDWILPCPAPTIDGLNYSHHPEFEELWIGLSMHCSGSHHFRWSFSETWEYHSEINTQFEYIPEAREVRYYTGPTLYYCWNDAVSSQINIFSTVNQTDDRFEELAFYTIPLTDKRLQVMYRIRVQLQAMSEDAYNYWNNMQQNSDGQGSIFSPTPSEMASNIRCSSDPTVRVMGYLNAAVPAEGELYYDNALNNYFLAQPFHIPVEEQVDINRPDSMAYWYSKGYLPYQAIYGMMSAKPTHYMWSVRECIDCRMLGGVKTKPEGWPNDHS